MPHRHQDSVAADDLPLHGLTSTALPADDYRVLETGRSRSSELLEQQPGDGVRSLAVREMSDTVEHYPSIGVKVMLEPSRFRRRVTEVGASLDHQRRHGQVVDRVEAYPEVVVSGVYAFGGVETGAVGVQCDRRPVGVAKDRRRRPELGLVEPAGRAPCLPLTAGEANGVANEGLGPCVDVHQPLIPKPLALGEVRQDEPTARLVAERQRGD